MLKKKQGWIILSSSHTQKQINKNAMKVTTVKPNFGKDSISNVFNDETFKFESTSKENVKSIIVSENQIIEAIKLLSQNSQFNIYNKIRK